MIIRPVENPDTGQWEILEWDNRAATAKPLPRGMRVQAGGKDAANELVWMVAEQLGSLGVNVQMELAE